MDEPLAHQDKLKTVTVDPAVEGAIMQWLEIGGGVHGAMAGTEAYSTYT